MAEIGSIVNQAAARDKFIVKWRKAGGSSMLVRNNSIKRSGSMSAVFYELGARHIDHVRMSWRVA